MTNGRPHPSKIGRPTFQVYRNSKTALNGFAVTSVRTGREALEALANARYDAVLSDIYMPDCGGLELVESLRAVDPAIPIMPMTAQGSLEATVDAVARGAGSIVVPPQDPMADRPSMEEMQKRYLQLVLEENRWNRRQAAAVLNLDRRTIQRLIARYQLQGVPDPDDGAETEAGNDSADMPMDSR